MRCSSSGGGFFGGGSGAASIVMTQTSALCASDVFKHVLVVQMLNGQGC
jgi:hypothetical protein